MDPRKPDPSQLELFTPDAAATDAPSPQDATPATRTEAATEPARTARPAAKASALPPGREDAFARLLQLSQPVRAGSRAAGWLKERRIYRKTWVAQDLRVVEPYGAVQDAMLAHYARADLIAWGLFNPEGHLRFYRHNLLIPWRDGERVVSLTARSTDPATEPAELSPAGPITAPFNADLLDGKPGRLYLCAGPLDALVLLEAGFPAVAVPERIGIKAAWLPRFRNKSVYLAFDGTAEGQAAAARAMAALAGRAGDGVEVHALEVPAGRDVGAWLAGR